MSDLVRRLRALSAHQHDDLSIGSEAADELDRLTLELEEARKYASLYQVVRRMNVPQFQEAMLLNLKTGKPFDQIVADLAPFHGLPHPDAQEK